MATFTGGNNNDTFAGGSADDTISGGGGSDTLSGGGGNDTIEGGSGGDSLSGGTGNDTLSYATSTAGVTVNIGTNTASGGHATSDTISGFEGIIGSGFNDRLTGTSGNNTIDGGNGNDTIDGGAGNDVLIGGAGNDSLVGGTGDDTLFGGLGADTLTGNQGLDIINYSQSNAAVNINLTNFTATGGHATGDVLTGVDGIVGSAFNDTLIGFNDFSTDPTDAYTNVISGGQGNDFIDGRGGDDQLHGDEGNDTVLGGGGQDVVTGGLGADNLDGGADSDTVSGGDGNDTILGGTGRDLLTGDLGDDSIDGGDDADTVSGGDGNDTILGGSGADLLQGNADDDSLSGGTGNDTLRGGTGNDTLVGGADNDSIEGGTGRDLIVNDAGADTIIGGDDQDTILGASIGDVIDGSEGGVDQDTLDLTGLGPLRVIYDPLNSENGTIEFLNGTGQVTGTATFTNIETVIPCFTAGTPIETARGMVAVETLAAGDLVMTRDAGLQPVRWVGIKHLSKDELLANPSLRPIRFSKGSLGGNVPERPLLVSPQHRMLVAGPGCELLFGENEVLVPATHFLGQAGVDTPDATQVTYVHILFAQHQIVNAGGCWSESFQPGARVLDAADAVVLAEILALFPKLASEAGRRSYRAARQSLRPYEARALLAGLGHECFAAPIDGLCPAIPWRAAG